MLIPLALSSFHLVVSTLHPCEAATVPVPVPVPVPVQAAPTTPLEAVREQNSELREPWQGKSAEKWLFFRQKVRVSQGIIVVNNH